MRLVASEVLEDSLELCVFINDLLANFELFLVKNMSERSLLTSSSRVFALALPAFATSFVLIIKSSLSAKVGSSELFAYLM